MPLVRSDHLPGRVPSQPLKHHHTPFTGKKEKQRRPWCCANTLYSKVWDTGMFSVVLITNLKPTELLWRKSALSYQAQYKCISHLRHNKKHDVEGFFSVLVEVLAKADVKILKFCFLTDSKNLPCSLSPKYPRAVIPHCSKHSGCSQVSFSSTSNFCGFPGSEVSHSHHFIQIKVFPGTHHFSRKKQPIKEITVRVVWPCVAAGADSSSVW